MKRAASPQEDGLLPARKRSFSKTRGINPCDCALAAQPEARDQRAVTLDVDALQVTEQTTTLTNQQQQATT
ncbi:hypothetical protein GCM10011399_17880 [Subtercola lobariae]|uniref:Uncharacterized protein n=1 Tax=Subtercola lobariae TaxID=1588641 RepID=A0A917B786_9MICO|nr:hypothetical protein GCM10011399_17880 [Subtercola lobariae]